MNDVLKLDIFSDYTALTHAISTKAFGSMKKENGEMHYANLLKFAKSQKLPKVPITMNQIHSATIGIIENDRELVLPQTDGMITNKKGLPLGVKSADCLPVLLYDPENNAIGAVHAGRKGLAAGILHAAVKALHEIYGSEPKDLIIGVGPSIEKKCYEVSKDIIEEFVSKFPDFKNIYEEKGAKFNLDLRSVALQLLQKEGILTENISISDICTKCDERFFSYRRGDRNALFLSVISLV